MYVKFVAILVCLIALAFAAPALDKDAKYIVSEYSPNNYYVEGVLNECFYGGKKIVDCTPGDNFVTEPCDSMTGISKREVNGCTNCICDYTMQKGYALTNFGTKGKPCPAGNAEWYINKFDNCVNIYSTLAGKYNKTEDSKIKITYHEGDTTCAEESTGAEIFSSGACISNERYTMQIFLTDKIIEGGDENDDGSIANLVASGLAIVGALLIAA